MRQIMFSKQFPATHPSKGQPTYFVEKIWAGLWKDHADHDLIDIDFGTYPMTWPDRFLEAPKYHTIRAGENWKVGDVFLPKIWSGLPYRSKTITFGPPLEVKKVWKFEIDQCGVMSVGGWYAFDDDICKQIAVNDVLTEVDFHFWFPKEKVFSGQIICWSDKPDYSVEKLQPDA